MKILAVGLFVLSACASFCRADADDPTPAAVTDTRPNAAAVVIGDNTVSLGHIRGYGITNVAFRVRNISDKPINGVRVLSTCPCIKGTIDKIDLLPQEEATVTASLDAALVNGAFKRSLWIQLPTHGSVRMSLSGVIDPLFRGFPDETVMLTSMGLGLTLTNTYTFSPLEAGLTLAAPVGESSAGLTLAHHFTTNLNGETSYSMTAFLTTTAESRRYTGSLTFPVAGTPIPVRPMVLRYRVSSALPLIAKPGSIDLGIQTTPPKEQTVHFLLQSRSGSLVPADLTWDPLPQGMTLTCEATGRRKVGLAVTLMLSPEVVKMLTQADKKPFSLRFYYPDHQPTEVTIGPERETLAPK